MKRVPRYPDLHQHNHPSNVPPVYAGQPGPVVVVTHPTPVVSVSQNPNNFFAHQQVPCPNQHVHQHPYPEVVAATNSHNHGHR